MKERGNGGMYTTRRETQEVQDIELLGDMTATRLGVILRDSVESSVVHSLILKPFETFYYNLI